MFSRCVSQVFLALLLAVSVASTVECQAAPLPAELNLREIDYRLLGDNLITLDVLTNRQWLDLTESTNLPYDDMIGSANDCNPRCTTGPYRGWTFAREPDVRALFDDAGLPAYSSFNFDQCVPWPECRDNLEVFIAAVGATSGVRHDPPWCSDVEMTRCAFVYRAAGITRTVLDASFVGYDPSFGSDFVAAPLAEIDDCPFCPSAWTSPYEFGNPSGKAVRNTDIGVWLFRVPEPSSALLIVSAIGLLVAWRVFQRVQFVAH